MLSCDEEEYVDMAADDVRIPIAEASLVNEVKSKELVGCGAIIVRVGCVVDGE